jgi:hypothetical protein
LQSQHATAASRCGPSSVPLPSEFSTPRHDPGPKPRGKIEQRGVSVQALCERCNNLTGAWYVPELRHWTRALADIVANQPLPIEQHDRIVTQLRVEVRLTSVYPLRFANAPSDLIRGI